MPTSIHIRPELLAQVDRRAKASGISRNKYIVRALQRVIAEETAWTPGFFEALTPLAEEDVELLDAMVEAIGGRHVDTPLVEL